MEKRAKLKKSRKEAKTQAKKKDEDQIQEMPQSEVLVQFQFHLYQMALASDFVAYLALYCFTFSFRMK